jgi:transposase
MKRFIEGADRGQSTLFPECVEDWIGEENPVRVIDVFVDELDLAELGVQRGGSVRKIVYGGSVGNLKKETHDADQA